jgi:hypothetical protein
MAAFYHTTAGALVAEDHDKIIGKLITGAGTANLGEHLHTQTRAWRRAVVVLQAAALELLAKKPACREWGILLEYPIPRRQRRIDAVLLAEDIIIVLEFKVGAESYDPSARRQAEDYALDLRDFHEQSCKRVIVPVLIATEAPAAPSSDAFAVEELVRSVRFANSENLSSVVSDAFDLFHCDTQPVIVLNAWNFSGYKPVPTIIEAAEALFAGQSVREISSSHADRFNLSRTASKLVETVTWAQANKRKVICFVTGVPGAGKTLAGLTVTHDSQLRSHDRPAGIFLSGNGPLVRIVRAALARDSKRRTGLSVSESKRRIDTFVQNVHSFLREYSEHPNALPPDRVVVFDEAQRAWNAAKQKKKFQRDSSEASVMLSIMDRQPDWAVIIALVGGGQEIHDGEAGLAEWGRTLSEQFLHWRILASPNVLAGGVGLSGHRLFESENWNQLDVATDDSLHLPVSIRTFKAENVSRWVDALLSRNAREAKTLFSQLGDFPIVITRSIDTARSWLKFQTRGERRCGLVASSGALRLRAHGLELSGEFRGAYPYEEWFLAPPGDVRSSYQLEVAATEFECQGLELDWVGICWGGDLAAEKDEGWLYRRFHGSGWRNYQRAEDKQYLLNKYRVLLTRARQGFVIWVPRGDLSDVTRNSILLDATADFIGQCGIPTID